MKRPFSSIIPNFKNRTMPMMDHILAHWMGSINVHLTVNAFKRGDVHEFNHLYAAMAASNSNHSQTNWCHINKTTPLTRVDTVTIPLDQFPQMGKSKN